MLQEEDNAYPSVRSMLVTRSAATHQSVRRCVWMLQEETNAFPNVENMQEMKIVAIHLNQHVNKSVLMLQSEENVYHNVESTRIILTAVHLPHVPKIVLKLLLRVNVYLPVSCLVVTLNAVHPLPVLMYVWNLQPRVSACLSVRAITLQSAVLSALLSVLSKLNMDSVPRPVKLMKEILTVVLPPALLNVQTGGGDLVLPKEFQSVKIFQDVVRTNLMLCLEL